jgi:hypothetical protein
MLWAAALMGAPPTESDAARAKAAICVARAKCVACAPPVEAKPSVVFREVWHTDARGRLVRELVPCADGTCAK